MGEKKKKKKKKKKKATPPPKESSGSESSDEEEKTAKPEKDDSDSPDDEPNKEAKAKDESDSGSSEDEDKEPSKKMDVDGDDSDSESEEAPKKSEPVEKPKNTGSDSDSDSGSDSDAPSKKEEKPALKKEESDNSSDSGSEDEKPKPKKEKAKAKADSDDSSSDESSSEEDKPAEKEDDSDSSSDSEKGKSPPATPNKRKSSFGDGSPAKKGRPEGQSKFGGAKTELKGTTQKVFVGNLSYDIDDEKCKEFFKDIGELTDIYWLTDRESGDFKGCGFLTFASIEMADKAVEEMAGKELMGRSLKIDWAEERKGGAKKKGGRVPDWVNNPLSERPDNCYSVFLGNLDFNITEDDVKKHFKECGELKSVRWMQKDGEFKGAGFVEFETTEAVDKAVKLCGKEIIGRAARVDYAKPRAPR